MCFEKSVRKLKMTKSDKELVDLDAKRELGSELLESVRQMDELKDFQPFYAAYAKLLVQAERFSEARLAYDKAIELAQNEASRMFLLKESRLLC